MNRPLLISFVALILATVASAQTPQTLGETAKAVIGSWEFSNANRDKVCIATFKSDPTKVGFKVEFDQNCPTLFPLVAEVAGWIFPDNDLLRLLNAEGKSLVEFSEVEDRIYEAPTPGVGVLFLQNATSAALPPKSAEEVAGNWAVVRGETPTPICQLSLTATAAKDNFVLAVKPGCDADIARLNFTQWRMDRGELVLLPARGNSWRFEEIDNVTWRRLPESADKITLVRQ